MNRTIIITGSRHYTDHHTIYTDLNTEWRNTLNTEHDTLTIRHGDYETGADRITRTWCEQAAHYWPHRIIHDPHPADWDTHGTKAGPIRNTHMINLGAHHVYAYPLPESVGTWHTIKLARRAHIPTTIRHPTKPTH